MAYIPSEKDFDKYEPYTPSSKDFDKYEEEEYKPTSAWGAFGRSAQKTPLEAIHKILSMTPLSIVPLEKAAPSLYKQGDKAHPFATTLGEFAVPGLAALRGIKAGTSLAALNRISDLAQKSKYHSELKNTNKISSEADNELQGFEDYLKRAYGSKNEASLLRASDKANSQENEVAPLAKQAPEDLSNRLPGATGEGLIPEAENNTRQAEQGIESVNNEIRSYLNHNETHDVNLQRIVNPILRANRQQISSGYNDLENDLSQHNVTIPNTNTAKELTSQLSELIKNGGIHSEEATKLVGELDRVGKNETIPADTYLRAYRTAEQLSREAMNKARQIGKVTQEQRQEFENLSQQYAEQAEKMSRHLEASVGEDILPRLSTLNRRWATEVRSLDRNPFHRKLSSNNPMKSPNLMQDLRGDAPGQDFLRQVISGHSGALRNLVGRTYANNPEGLLNAPPEEMQYIERLPSLTGMRNRLQQAQQRHGQSLAEEQRVREHVENLARENSRISKAHEESVKKEKAKTEARKLHAELKEKQSNIERDIKINRKLREQKENSLKKSMELDKKVQQMEADLSRIKSSIKEVAKLIAKGVAGVETINIIRKIFK